MKELVFKGCGTAIATPFTEDGVNFEEFGKLLEFQIENKVDAIIVCGTTGESSTMTTEEKKETIKYAIDKVNKRTKVIIGTGSNNTKTAIEMSKYAEEAGADALLVVTPYYNKTTSQGLQTRKGGESNVLNSRSPTPIPFGGMQLGIAQPQQS